MRPLPVAGVSEVTELETLFVDPAQGDDSGDGSRDRPWRTLARAARDLTAGQTLFLRGGTYYEQATLSLEGTAAKPIVVSGYPGELAVLDGGLREFFETPEGSWEPFEGGAPGEFRSTRSYPGLGGVFGFLGDSMVPLHSYLWLSDLRAENEHWEGRDEAMYCGPGVWLDPRTQRLHLRLAPVRLAALPEDHRYRGVEDPRRIPLVLSGRTGVTLTLEKSRFVEIRDLIVRGAGRSAIEILDSHHLVLDGVSAFAGRHALVLEGTEDLRILSSRFRGRSAPWSSRARLKYKSEPDILVRTRGLVRKNRRMEIAFSEFSDGHDGVFLGDAEDVDFHHNLVENFNDDGIFLTARGAPNGNLRIYGNRISRTLTAFAFGWGRGQPNIPGRGVFIFRNLVELLEPVYYRMPASEEPQSLDYYGEINRDHGSPIWEPAAIYHNTFVVREVETRSPYLFGWGSHLDRTWRRVFNNIFVQVVGDPGFGDATAGSDLESDANLFWTFEATDSDLLLAFRESEAFRASRALYGPGWEAASLFADPLFAGFEVAGGGDYRLESGSPAVDRGIALPAAWPRLAGVEDEGPPDLGAFHLGSRAVAVGPEARHGVSRRSAPRR
jgi:hypothetical protein